MNNRSDQMKETIAKVVYSARLLGASDFSSTYKDGCMTLSYRNSATSKSTTIALSDSGTSMSTMSSTSAPRCVKC